MYSAVVVVRWGVRFERSEENDWDVLGIVWEGLRDSDSMVTSRPRVEVSAWRDLKASISSFEAVRCQYMVRASVCLFHDT